MKKSGLPTVLAAVVALLIAGYLVWQLRAERQSLVQLQERATSLELALQKPPPAVAPPVAVPPEPAASASVPPAAMLAAPPAPAPAAPKQALIVMRADGTRDPDPNAGARLMLAMLYGDLKKELGLSAEQVDALAQFMASGDGSPGKVEALLGEKYEQFRELGRSSDMQRRMTSLRTSLASSAHPLTDQQAERLGPAMVAETRRKDEEVDARPRPTEPRALLEFEEQNVKVTEASNERLLAAARSYLEPEQVAVLQSSMNMLLNAQRRNLQSRRAQVEAGGTGAPEPAPPIYMYPAGTAPPVTPPR